MPAAAARVCEGKRLNSNSLLAHRAEHHARVVPLQDRPHHLPVLPENGGGLVLNNIPYNYK